MKTRGGFNLLEIIVSMALMVLCLCAMQSVFVAGFQASSSGTKATQMFRSAAIGFDEASRELRQCEKVYAPDAASLAAGYAPRQGVTRPLVFRRYDARTGQKIAVGLTMSDKAHTFLRVVYDPSFNPADATTWQVSDPTHQILTLSQSVQNLAFKTTTSQSIVFIQMDIASYPESALFPIESTVPLRGL
jgi:hypothetical protein